MMRFLSLLILAAASITLALFMHHHPGYVLIQWNHIAIETTLWAALLALLLIYWGIILVFKSVKAPFVWPKRWQHYRTGKQLTSTYKSLEIALMSGINSPQDATKAWKNLAKHAQGNQTLYWLTACRIAVDQDQPAAAEYAFNQAKKHLSPTDEATRQALCLTEAKWLHFQGKNESAWTLLHNIPISWQKTEHAASLLFLLEIERNNLKSAWATYLGYLTKSSNHWKNDGSHSIALRHILPMVWAHNDPEEVFYALPKSWQTDAEVMANYLRQLIKNNQHKLAEKRCLSYLKQHWSSSIARLYGQSIQIQQSRQIKQVNQWLIDHPKDSNLHAALGYLLLKSDMKTRALSCFKQAVNLRPQEQDLWMLYTLQKELGQVAESDKTLAQIMQQKTHES
jgi:HemY protein